MSLKTRRNQKVKNIFDHATATPEQFIDYLSKSLAGDFYHQMNVAGLKRPFEISKIASGYYTDDWHVMLGEGYPDIIIGNNLWEGELLLFIDKKEGVRLTMLAIHERLLTIIKNEFKSAEKKGVSTDCQPTEFLELGAHV